MEHSRKLTSLAAALLLAVIPLQADVLEVGAGCRFPSLQAAAPCAAPGDTIMIREGVYPGDQRIVNLQGTATRQIYILSPPDETVIFRGGQDGWHMTAVAYLFISGFTFTEQAHNGLRIDDGETERRLSHHIVLENCIWQNVQPLENNDLLKLAGVDDVTVRNCRFYNNFSNVGSGLDMVGCHDATIERSYFENMTANAIQVKGGSQHILIRQNFFRDCGRRTLNLGGTTGLIYFRPANANFAVRDVKVYANIIVGSEAAVAFAGCVDADVANNTIYQPEIWVIRILQANIGDPRFIPCSDNTFRNNIVYGTVALRTECNVGSDTNPETFRFANNLWCFPNREGWAGPELPSAESNGIIQQDPLFFAPLYDDFSLLAGSPAIGGGAENSGPVTDFWGRLYAAKPSIGAIEGAYLDRHFWYPYRPDEDIK